MSISIISFTTTNVGSCLPYWWMGKGHFVPVRALQLAAIRGDRVDDKNLESLKVLLFRLGKGGGIMKDV